jgi:hypothetical protein
MDQSNETRRRLMLRISALGLAGVLASERSALAQGERPAGLYRAQGSVRVNGKPARQGAALRPGDTVEAGARSQAVFVIGRDAFLLRADSRVETSGSGLFADVLRLATGKLLSVFASGERRLEAPTAVIGIRGTGIYIEAEPRRTYVCTCYGEAVLQPRDRPEARETVATRHHEQPRYIYSDRAMPPGQMMQRAPVINHTDAELILLESLVGREPPFVKAGGPPY